MANYNLLKDATVRLVYGTQIYILEVYPDLSFSQTFTDKSTPSRTLQDNDSYFEKASIHTANPANFEFKIPVFKEPDLEVVHDRLIDCDSFDLYISTKQDVFKLEKCVFTNGTYGIERSTPLTLTVSGEASKLSIVGTTDTYTVPGAVQNSTQNREYLMSEQLHITLDGVDISSEVFSTTLELQNDVKWNNNKTIAGGIEAKNAGSNVGAIYPEKYSVKKKVLSGSIGRYLCDTNQGLVNNFQVSSDLVLSAGKPTHPWSTNLFGVKVDAKCSLTNRSGVAEVFTQNYDWRSIDNTTALAQQLTYNHN